MKQYLSLTLAAVVGCVTALIASGGWAQEQGEQNPGPPDTIRGACVVETADKHIVTLGNPTVQFLGDRQFLVGPQVDTQKTLNRAYTKVRYGEDATMWIPLDSVAEIAQIPTDE